MNLPSFHSNPAPTPRRAEPRGQALVETAMILPLLVLLLLLGIDFGRVFFDSIELRNAAHEATMYGGTTPDAVCADVTPIIDREMDRDPADGAICGSGALPGRVYVTRSVCELGDGGPCPVTPYPADSDLRYHVELSYRFQPVVPFIGLLTGNGLGGTIPVYAENRSPILVGYEGG